MSPRVLNIGIVPRPKVSFNHFTTKKLSIQLEEATTTKLF